jgi:hypothetical protein
VAAVVGKIALARSAPINHSRGVAMNVTARGLSTHLLPHGTRTFTIEFDFVGHELVVQICNGKRSTVPLENRSVADFLRTVMTRLGELELPVRIWTVPTEVPNPIRFEQDTIHSTYNPEHANRFWSILTRVVPVFAERRTAFIGKTSPVHFFWGAADLAVTRFSGRRAPPRDGPAFMREAYSHEVISHGFWFGSSPLLEPAFYAYAAPEPAGLKEAPTRPAAAYYHRELGEFILPYDAVRTSSDPEGEIGAFIDSTYQQAATLAQWDRRVLERPAVASGSVAGAVR